jgi:hypothetical protein
MAQENNSLRYRLCGIHHLILKESLMKNLCTRQAACGSFEIAEGNPYGNDFMKILSNS